MNRTRRCIDPWSGILRSIGDIAERNPESSMVKSNRDRTDRGSDAFRVWDPDDSSLVIEPSSGQIRRRGHVSVSRPQSRRVTPKFLLESLKTNVSHVQLHRMNTDSRNWFKTKGELRPGVILPEDLFLFFLDAFLVLFSHLLPLFFH